jgi:hypothetical protein
MAKLIVSSYTDGTANTAGTAASMIPTYNVITLPSGYFMVGRQLRITASGRISCAVTTPGTARYDVRLGGTVVADTTAMPLNIVAQTNVNWYLQMLLTCRAVGSGTSANIIMQGLWVSPASVLVPAPATGPGPGGQVLPYNTAPAVGGGFNSTSALTLDMFFTQTVGTGSHTCHQYTVEQLDDQ